MVDFAENRTSTNFHAEGTMARLIGEFDWSKTSIGHHSEWSESLNNCVSLMLSNRFPMILWWGPEYIQLYNDAYIPVLGLKHQRQALGQPCWKCWEEIWDV